MKKSISYWSFSGKNVFEAMRLAKDAGFDGIELTLDAEGDVTMETAPEKLAEIRRAAEEIGIALPSVASSLYWAYSFTSDDPEEREKAHQAAVCEIKTAKALGADTVLIVPGSVSVEFVPERPVVAYDVCWQRAVAEMKRLAPVAAEHQIHIGVENVWNKFLLSPLEMRAFIDEIGSEWIGSYFDVAALPLTPTTDDMLMIEPLFWRAIMGVTAWMKLNADLRFTVSTASHCASDMRIIRPSLVMPALFTRMSMRPKSFTIRSMTSCVSSKFAAFEA